MASRNQYRSNVQVRYYLREDTSDRTFILHNIYGPEPSYEDLRRYLELQRTVHPGKDFSIWKEVTKTEEALTEVLL